VSPSPAVQDNTANTLGSSVLVGALKEAALAALVALGLFFFLIGIKTDQGPTGALVIATRFKAVAIIMVLVFAGYFVRALVSNQRSSASDTKLSLQIAPYLQWASRFMGAAFLVFAIAVPYLFYNNRYVLDLGILVLTYVMLGWGLNIVVGLAGLLDLGYVAFYAVGAYSYALLAQNFGLSFWIGLPLAGILAAFAGVLLGFPVLRLRGDYLAIVTLGFGEIIRLILLNWRDVTGGPNGIPGIPRPSFFGFPFDENANGFAATFGLEFTPAHRLVFLFYVILALALITNWVTLRLRRLPIGRAWEALREDEIACRSLGVNTTNTKLTAFAIGAMFGGFAGAFFATRQGFISPESFNFGESALVLAIVVLGGMGSQIGIAIAALVMIGGIEALRNLSWLKDYSTQQSHPSLAWLSSFVGDDFNPSDYRMLIFGIAMVIIMIWRPRGLVSTRTPSLLLAKIDAKTTPPSKDSDGR
jgi:branched-chain amino acid transport system permease protein